MPSRSRRVVEALACIRRRVHDVLICPPATLIARLAGQLRDRRPSFTLRGRSAPYRRHRAARCWPMPGQAVIVGHSDYRADHGRRDRRALKAAAAWRAGLTAVLCLGETEAERCRCRRSPASPRSWPARSPSRPRRNLVIA